MGWLFCRFWKRLKEKLIHILNQKDCHTMTRPLGRLKGSQKEKTNRPSPYHGFPVPNGGNLYVEAVS
jgi:hypothetical protein